MRSYVRIAMAIIGGTAAGALSMYLLQNTFGISNQRNALLILSLATTISVVIQAIRQKKMQRLNP